MVEEEAGPAEQEVCGPADALEGVVDGLGRGEELMLPDMKLRAMRHVQRDDMAGPVTAERDHAVAGRLGDEDLHARHHAFESTLHRLHPNADGRVLPQEDMMLEIDRHPADLDGKDRNQLAVDVV